MKKLMIFTVLFSLFFLTSCEKLFFSFVVNFPLPKTFQVDNAGAFSTNETFSSSEISDALEIPDDAQIPSDGVTIKAISMNIASQAGNEASGVRVSGRIRDATSGIWNIAFSDYLIPVPTVGQDTSVVILTLNDIGIETLRDQINAIVDPDASGFDVEVELSGDTETPGQRIVADVTLTIHGSSQIEKCLDAFLSTGESCE